MNALAVWKWTGVELRDTEYRDCGNVKDEILKAMQFYCRSAFRNFRIDFDVLRVLEQ
jgi:hypothetical protein